MAVYVTLAHREIHRKRKSCSCKKCWITLFSWWIFLIQFKFTCILIIPNRVENDSIGHPMKRPIFKNQQLVQDFRILPVQLLATSLYVYRECDGCRLGQSEMVKSQQHGAKSQSYYVNKRAHRCHSNKIYNITSMKCIQNISSMFECVRFGCVALPLAGESRNVSYMICKICACRRIICSVRLFSLHT